MIHKGTYVQCVWMLNPHGCPHGLVYTCMWLGCSSVSSRGEMSERSALGLFVDSTLPECTSPHAIHNPSTTHSTISSRRLDSIMTECHMDTAVKDGSEIAVIPHAIALAYDRTRSSRVGLWALPAGVTHYRCDSAATGMVTQSIAKWFVNSGQVQSPPDHRPYLVSYALC